jgi:hypothetical protein
MVAMVGAGVVCITIGIGGAEIGIGVIARGITTVGSDSGSSISIGVASNTGSGRIGVARLDGSLDCPGKTVLWNQVCIVLGGLVSGSGRANPSFASSSSFCSSVGSVSESDPVMYPVSGLSVRSGRSNLCSLLT